jgi:uncharacterized protein involved in outer membrane biogenesis
MKKLVRWAFRLLILLVVLLVAAILLLDTVAREVFEYKLEQRTGLEVKVDAVRVGILNPRLTIEGLVVYNRPEFGGAPMIDLPELHAEYDRQALWSHKLHFYLLRVNLREISIIENSNGVLNLTKAQKEIRKTGDEKSSSHSEDDYKLQPVDTLNLTLGTGIFKSYRNPQFDKILTPRMTNEVYLKVNSFNNLLELVLLKSGVNPLDKNAGQTNDPVTYWTQKFSEMGKK